MADGFTVNARRYDPYKATNSGFLWMAKMIQSWGLAKWAP